MSQLDRYQTSLNDLTRDGFRFYSNMRLYDTSEYMTILDFVVLDKKILIFRALISS